jgi:nucleoside-diphosphate kinase
MLEKTFAILKPDAVEDRITGKLVSMIEDASFDIIRMQKIRMNPEQAREFYAVHKDKPFYGELVDYMISGPVVIMVLQKDDAIKAWRTLMGETNPAKAAPGTIRNLFGKSIGRNVTHGSDAPETAVREIKQFFPEL